MSFVLNICFIDDNNDNSHWKVTVGTRYIMKKYPYNCCAMTMYQSLLMALVSIPFRVLENWGVKKCHCSQTEVPPSRFWVMTCFCQKLINLYLLVKDLCIILILFLCYIKQLLVSVTFLHSSCWFVAQACLPRPLVDWAPWNDTNSLTTTYTTHLHKNIYIYIYFYHACS